jgi:hypothetical protein
VGREDWYLFPEGDIVANHPFARDGSYYEAGQELAAAQRARPLPADVPTTKSRKR